MKKNIAGIVIFSFLAFCIFLALVVNSSGDAASLYTMLIMLITFGVFVCYNTVKYAKYIKQNKSAAKSRFFPNVIMAVFFRLFFLGVFAGFVSQITIGISAVKVAAYISALLLLAFGIAYNCVNYNQKTELIKAYRAEADRENRLLQDGRAEIDRKKQELEAKQADIENQIKKLEQLSESDKNERQKMAQFEEEHKQKIKNLNRELADIKKRIDFANSELIVAETSVFEDEGITSEEFKDKLALLRVEYKELIKSNNAVNQTDPSVYAAGKKKRLTDNIKQILRCFNSEASGIISSATASNIEKQRAALSKSFETINSIFATDGLALNKQLLEYRLRELNIVYSYQKKKEEEREEQKAIRAQMLEEEKVRREIEREKEKVEKEENQFRNEVDKLMKYLAQASDGVQKQLYVDKIKELEEKIKLLEKDKENILQREQNTRAGFVYIISNIGSFGENVYKIGMTRRLEPMDRIDELGSASVPFPFDVHAMIFSDDAPSLETTLHNTFKENQVNLVNPRKEFYNVRLEEIEKVVKDNYNATVKFTQIAEAAQYRESVRLRQREHPKTTTPNESSAAPNAPQPHSKNIAVQAIDVIKSAKPDVECTFTENSGIYSIMITENNEFVGRLRMSNNKNLKCDYFDTKQNVFFFTDLEKIEELI